MRNGFMVAVLALGACTAAGGQDAQPGSSGTNRSYAIGTFDAVDLAGPHNVTVRVGNAPSIRAEGDAKDLDQLDIKVEDGVLKIGAKDRGFTRWGSHRPVTIAVSAPSLRSAAIAGSGNIAIDRAEAENFQASIAGSGDLTINALRARRAHFKIAGSGNLRGQGEVEQSKVSIAGSGNASLAGINSRRVDVSIAGAGKVGLTASETVTGSVVGSGDIEVAGGARCAVKRMGAGRVRCV